MTPTIAIFAGLLSGCVGAIAAYLSASRRLSGKIDTSEAAQLWAESKSIREEYRERIGVSERRTLRLEERVAILERDNGELVRANGLLAAKNEVLDGTIDEFRIRIDTLQQENEQLRETIDKLRRH